MPHFNKRQREIILRAIEIPERSAQQDLEHAQGRGKVVAQAQSDPSFEKRRLAKVDELEQDLHAIESIKRALLT